MQPNYENRIHEIEKLNIEINSYRPMLDEQLLSQIKEYFRIGLTYSSNAIEGNTLTETETKIILEDGLTVGGKPLKDHFEAVGHSEAFDFIYQMGKKKEISEKDILKIHKLFYYRVDQKNAGKYRTEKVIITGTEFVPPHPNKVPALMEKFILKLPKLRSKYHPIEFATFVHKELVTIHPFLDGNGRTARLLMNLILFQAGYTITVIPPILRNDYLWSLKESQTGKKDMTQFTHFISHVVYTSTKDYLRLLKSVCSEK